MPRSAARSEGRKAAVLLFVVILLAVGALLGGPTLLHRTGVWVSGGSPTIDPSLYAPTPTPTPTPRTPAPALGPADAGTLPNAAALQQRLGAIPRTGIGAAGLVVVDPATGNAIVDDRANAPMTPASTMKLLTSIAALQALGPDHQFSTSVVSPASGQIVLVGGGDPYLRGTGNPTYPARASIVDLADATATALKAAGQTSVALAYDDTLFAGPGWNPAWPTGYGDQVTTTSALWIDEGVAGGRHSQTPSADAANAFAELLKARGVQVSSVAAGTAPAGAAPIAAVRSLPLDLIVSELLLHSDNSATEVLFRQVAIAAGKQGSITEAQGALQAKLTELGLWVNGMKIEDGSGLSRGNLATPAVLAKAIAMGFENDRYRALVVGLPTAGADGTLYQRFTDPGSTLGRGVVRAKTGTLSEGGVHSLAGFAKTADGATVVFAFVTNQVPPDQALNARAWLDRESAVVASCGCR